MTDLVWRDKVRGYLNPKYEWLSKVSDREYARWERYIRTALIGGHLDAVETDKRIWEEIKEKEERYQEAKKKVLEQRERNRKLDVEINNKLSEAIDMLSTPGNPDAVLNAKNVIRRVKYEPVTASTKHYGIDYDEAVYKSENKPEMNGRIYYKNTYIEGPPYSLKNLPLFG